MKALIADDDRDFAREFASVPAAGGTGVGLAIA